MVLSGLFTLLYLKLFSCCYFINCIHFYIYIPFIVYVYKVFTLSRSVYCALKEYNCIILLVTGRGVYIFKTGQQHNK